MEVYSIGGGEVVYEVLKAVSLCLNGGSGTMRAMMTIGGLCGAFMVYFMVLYGNVEQILKSWAMPITFMISILFVPTSTVWVIDTITKFHYKIDKVPYGLAMFASNISKLGKGITEIVEQNFSTPDDLKYQKSGLMFGSDILEKSKKFKIVNQSFRENMRNFVGQCVKYDIMLNGKYSFDDLRNSPDLWGLITSQPSQNRGIFWIPLDGKGRSSYVTCAEAVGKFNQVWKAEEDRVAANLGRQLFSGRFIGYSGSNADKLVMNQTVTQALKREIMGSLQSTASYLGDLTKSSEEMLRQNILINAIEDSASENSKAAGNLVTYAENKALAQQGMNFDVVGRLAAKMLPIMKAVIEAIAYACFIFVIPFCMIPSGYKFLINWIGILIWLQAWPPMYAILNFIMNVSARAATLSEIGTAGGITIANCMGVSEANADMKSLAGYLAMSIPFICIAIVKGVGSFMHLAGQMTGVSMQAAGAGASEALSGNFSYGNVSLGNQTIGNMSQLQRSYASSLSVGGHSLNTGTTQIHNDAFGRTVTSSMRESGSSDYSSAYSNSEQYTKGISHSNQMAESAAESLSKAESASVNEVASAARSVSNMKANDITNRYNVGHDRAVQIANDARVVDSAHNGHEYSEGTNAGANIGASLGGSVGTPEIPFKKGRGRPSNASKWKLPSASAGFNIGGSGGVSANNATIHGDSEYQATSQDVNESARRFESFLKDAAASSRDDEVTRIAKEHQVTLGKVDQYRQEESFHRSQSQMLQEAYNNSQSLSYSAKRDLAGDVREFLQNENGLTTLQARHVMDSKDPKDKAMVEDAFKVVSSRLNSSPSGQMIKQNPNLVSFRNKDFKGEYNSRAAETKEIMNNREKQIAQQSDKLGYARGEVNHKVDSNMKRGESEIKMQREQINNRSHTIKQKEQNRADNGAAKSAWNEFWGKNE